MNIIDVASAVAQGVSPLVPSNVSSTLSANSWWQNGVSIFGELASLISTLIAVFAFVWGVNAWRREFIGKRRIELAEEVLALFYEAQAAIGEIRNPFGFVGEGASRQRSEDETTEQSETLDKAYVVFERYHKHEKLFAQLRSMKYRIMATFGAPSGEAFDELAFTLNEIFGSARMLGTYYWRRQRHLDPGENNPTIFDTELRRYEAIFWSMGQDNDQITPRVQRAVERIEAIARQAALT